ncbi:MAG: hypothetical protein C4543_08710 [Ignavibacteriales bacterium]|nr:MAG: hypothetical protein C4543_08710 [Ignavibacteriales bacterium]
MGSSKSVVVRLSQTSVGDVSSSERDKVGFGLSLSGGGSVVLQETSIKDKGQRIKAKVKWKKEINAECVFMLNLVFIFQFDSTYNTPPRK